MKILNLIIASFLALGAISSVVKASDKPLAISHTQFEDITWNELPDGRAISIIHTLSGSEEHITYIRFPAGFRTAVHTHSHTYYAILVKGTARHFEVNSENSSEWLLPASIYIVPGDVPHISECSEESTCIFAIHQHGEFNRSLVD